MGGRGGSSGKEFPVSSGMRLAEDLDSLSRTEIERLQQQNLTAAVAAARQAPAVHRRWPDLGSVYCVGDLARLPLLSPGELAAGCPPYSDEFLLGRQGSGLVLRSGGTAGKPKVLYHSWAFTEQVEHLGVRGVRAALPVRPQRIANCLFPAELNGAFGFVQELARLLPALVLPLGSRTSIADAAAMIAQHDVDTLISAPAYGTELITSAPRDRLLSLRTFLYIGEPMGEERQRAVAHAAPGLTVRSLSYSTSETGPIGYQCVCLTDTTHHVHEDGVIVEVVDEESGQPVPAGSVGDVVVTPLTDTGMALFRYRIGDRGYFNPGSCTCGSAARRLTLVGRTAQSLTVDGWVISSDQLMSALTDLGVTDPADCQLQVRWDFLAYRVRLLLSPRVPDGITAEAVARSLRGAYQMDQVLTSPRCTAFTVERIDPGGFARTDRGKVPVLYQDLQRSVHAGAPLPE
jgi:phenylacetate-coenzyme A ligase PaaK-like adenylate-forming protein